MNTINHAKLAKVTATHCCVCRAHLTDAESVEHGIGPICSGKYYNPQHEPTELMVQDALGLLALSGLPDHIIDGFLKVVDNDHANARKGSNLLVYWASCNYDDRQEVFKCSAIIRALGYDELADKLEIDRTAARMTKNADGSWTAYCGTKTKFEKDMAFVTGAVKDANSKVGSKVKWTIPASELDHFQCCLGVSYGGELACGDNPTGDPTRVWNIARKSWYNLRAFRDRDRLTAQPDTSTNGNGSGGPGLICLNLSGKGQLDVRTPYNAGFVNDLKLSVPYADRQWDHNRKLWVVKARHIAAVADLVFRYFQIELGA